MGPGPTARPTAPRNPFYLAIVVLDVGILFVIGQRRIEGPRDFAEQNGWPYLPRFGAGAAIGIFGISYARSWNRSTI